MTQSAKRVDLGDLIVNDGDNVPLTPGEAQILAKLEEFSTQLDELTEKINNINLSTDDGYSISGYGI